MEENEDAPRNDVYQVHDARGIGHAIRHFRQTAGLTQAELAERTAIPREYLIAMEHGLETEQLRRLFRLLRSLGLSISIQRSRR